VPTCKVRRRFLDHAYSFRHMIRMPHQAGMFTLYIFAS
jgi:hypothetical protein